MDNQQAIGLLFGGLYSGEGHFSVWKDTRKGGRVELRAEIGFSNSDPGILAYVIGILDSKQIRLHIRENSNGCFQVIVRHHKDMLGLLDLVEQYLLGRKKAEAALLRRFILNRMKYTVGGNEARGYTPEDFAIVEEKEKLRESPETTRLAELRALGRYSPPVSESAQSDSASQ